MKRITLKGLMSLGAFTLFLTTPSFGQTTQDKAPKQQKTVEQIFAEMDTNKDDKLSKEEAKDNIKTDFEKIDLDKNSFISKEELEKALKPESEMVPTK